MVDHFATLGIPRRFTLDLEEVERRYLDASRALHPDYHQNAGEAQKAASLALTARLNEAYLALKDPYRRVEHLMALAGGPTAAEVKSLDQAFLMESMEIRERMEQGGDTAVIEADLQSRLQTVLQEAGRPFDLGTPPPEVLRQVRGRLNAAKTLMSLLRGLE